MCRIIEVLHYEMTIDACNLMLQDVGSIAGSANWVTTSLKSFYRTLRHAMANIFSLRSRFLSRFADLFLSSCTAMKTQPSRSRTRAKSNFIWQLALLKENMRISSAAYCHCGQAKSVSANFVLSAHKSAASPGPAQQCALIIAVWGATPAPSLPFPLFPFPSVGRERKKKQDQFSLL